MKTIGYIRTSTNLQDTDKQKYQILNYTHSQKTQVDEFIEIEISSRKDKEKRRINELVSKLSSGDVLICTELSRLGRNMIETLGIVNEINEKNVKIIFINQPELSTKGPHANLILAFFGYLAEMEREFISIRTKNALKIAKEKGKILGRPKKGLGKNTLKLKEFEIDIARYKKLNIPIKVIYKIIKSDIVEKISYPTFLNYVKNYIN